METSRNRSQSFKVTVVIDTRRLLLRPRRPSLFSLVLIILHCSTGGEANGTVGAGHPRAVVVSVGSSGRAPDLPGSFLPWLGVDVCDRLTAKTTPSNGEIRWLDAEAGALIVVG